MKPVIISSNVLPTELFDIDSLLYNPLLMEEECVRVVSGGLNKLVSTIGSLLEHVNDPKVVVNLERYSKESYAYINDVARSVGHDGPVTLHLYITPSGGVSFPSHTDPDDVVVCLIEGEKRFEIDSVEFDMIIGCCYLIKRGIYHRAVSSGEGGSVMLSIGLERFLLDKSGGV